jgi:hypothetical protein
MKAIFEWFAFNWALVMFAVGFLSGGIFTRFLLIPRFCPECVRRREWTAKMVANGRKNKADGNTSPDDPETL